MIIQNGLAGGKRPFMAILVTQGFLFAIQPYIANIYIAFGW